MRELILKCAVAAFLILVIGIIVASALIEINS
jgi:hypothetical protein